MKITIPIRGSDFEEDFESYERFLNEIVTLSNNQILKKIINNQDNTEKREKQLIQNIKFSIIEGNIYDNSEPEFATELNKKHPFFHTEFINEYLIIDLNIINEEFYTQNDYCEIIIEDILKRLHFIINLSYSTNVDFLSGVIYSNENKYIGKTDIIASSLMYAYEHSRIMKWPKIKCLSLLETLNWFENFAIHPNDRSKNNLHRAINAFSQLFDDLRGKNSADLFWIMLGIEALLVDGNQNITSQFKEKSMLILGKPKEYTKKLNKLYEYRSKLVHGSLEIFPKYYSDYDEFDKEYYNYLEFAVSILLALIRELISKNKCSFEFELILKS